MSLIAAGEPALSAEKDIAYGVPLRVPLVDIHTIGAGGGSIARITRAGLLQVGPESAGAHPGPIAYGRGGTAVTVTDANGCTGTDSVIVDETENPTVEITGDLSFCNGDSSVLTATPAGGLAPYTFAWSTGGTASTITVDADGT